MRTNILLILLLILSPLSIAKSSDKNAVYTSNQKVFITDYAISDL